MPYLISFVAGAVAGIYVSNSTANVAKYALGAAAIFVGGKYVKAW